MTTFALSVPRIERATSAPRLSAIVKAVRSSVWPTQSHAFSLASDHDVSSMWADGAATDRGGHLGDDRLQHLGGPALQLGDHPQRDVQPEQVGGQLLDRPLGEPVRAGEHRQDRPQARAEGAGRDARGQLRTGGGPAAGAGQPVESVFIDVGADRRDLGDLVPQRDRGLHPGAQAPQPPQCVGLTSKVSRSLLGRDQRPGVSLVAGLAATLPPGRRGRRPPLDLHGGRVGRGRLGRVGGVLVEPRLQLSDPLLQARR